MKRHFASVMGLLLVALTVVGCGHYPPSPGWITLIDGNAGMENSYEIYAKGPEITVKLNGVVTVSAQDSRFPEGRIGLQFNGGPIKFRKLLVKEL